MANATTFVLVVKPTGRMEFGTQTNPSHPGARRKTTNGAGAIRIKNHTKEENKREKIEAKA
jgi:hypothetical protein